MTEGEDLTLTPISSLTSPPAFSTPATNPSSEKYQKFDEEKNDQEDRKRKEDLHHFHFCLSIVSITCIILITIFSVQIFRINHRNVENVCTVINHRVRIGCEPKGYASYIELKKINTTWIWLRCDTNDKFLTDELNYYYPINSSVICFINKYDNSLIYLYEPSSIGIPFLIIGIIVFSIVLLVMMVVFCGVFSGHFNQTSH